MKILLSFVFLILMCSCKTNEDKPEKSLPNRKILLGYDFKNEEVKFIEIVEIDHPMLGGVKNITKLSNVQKVKFLNELDNLKEKGLVKCGSKHVIRLIMAKDTLRLKVCGNLVSNRNNDIYFESSEKDFLLKYL